MDEPTDIVYHAETSQPRSQAGADIKRRCIEAADT
jgi:hypothetical protein